MARNFLLLFFVLFSKAQALQERFQVIKQKPYLEQIASFTCYHGDEVDATGVRRWLYPRYHYDLFDQQDRLIVQGVTRLSLGLLATWGTDIDVYSGNHKIGCIEGKLLTLSRAKFVFYDGNSREIASAYLEDDEVCFTLISNRKELVATLKGSYEEDISKWDLVIYKDAIDERMLRIFALFASDAHQYFLPKTESSYESKWDWADEVAMQSWASEEESLSWNWLSWDWDCGWEDESYSEEVWDEEESCCFFCW